MRNREKGSFTVEAALLMPMILGVTVLFIYISMFCFDRCTILYVSEFACLNALNESDPESYAKGNIDAELSKKLICRWDTDISVASDETGITASIRASSGVFGGVYEYIVRANKHFCPDY